jgi:hypothetical protein
MHPARVRCPSDKEIDTNETSWKVALAARQRLGHEVFHAVQSQTDFRLYQIRGVVENDTAWRYIACTSVTSRRRPLS